jgi:dolichol kinase
VHRNMPKRRLTQASAELLTHAVIIMALLGLYPLRLLYHSWKRHSNLTFRRRIHVPAAFDPATILYPPVLPVLIAISLFASSPKPLLPNILLGLAALPARVIPFNPSPLGYSSLHWLISIMPLIAAENTDVPSRLSAQKPYKLKLPPPHQGLDPELLVCLFPLHQALLPPLYYLTTTSLLPTELHLLSIGLINLLLLSESPQAVILTILLWMGGVGVFILCGKVLKWGVALARIPRWRLRHAGQVIRARQSFLQILNKSLGSRRGRGGHVENNGDSDADDDDVVFEKRPRGLKIDMPQPSTGSIWSTDRTEPQSAAETTKKFFDKITSNTEEGHGAGRTRSNTLPALAAQNHTSSHGYSHRKRSRSIAQSYLELTPSEATARKWLYAAYFYLVVVVLILGPIRYAVGKYALYGHEPFGWAISYLFGNMPSVRWKVFEWSLEWWIPLPSRLGSDDLVAQMDNMPVAERLGLVMLGEANTRLLLCIYCMVTIIAGLISVFSLSAVVEVDTRRKVFHGTMVAMLLPTIYVDPCFVALALALVLAIFLLLDLIRASQLPPLSKPIARFLTPYVDGRDLRGPVVVSHIFLLIGCAIPLWLSLAGVERAGEEPWREWGVKKRDISMVSGVVCVGMGDAAASLIGRRYGRRRWPWAGGKSLEGSLAFAVAVTAGLVFGKAWLYAGWGSGHMASKTVGRLMLDAAMTMGKASICAAGASLNEAVLTGGNDNVIVPVVLWVLVRGVRL